MVIRRTLFVLMCLLASSLYMYGQIAVKTNVAMDAVAIPNLGVEVGLSKKLTLDVPMYYNPRYVASLFWLRKPELEVNLRSRSPEVYRKSLMLPGGKGASVLEKLYAKW